ncbi:translation initiation factor IF-2 N-terminal domain-containing protein, partial [Paracoccaceae bacterium]|nr:translation initiation factor IF-2 N-terminal domain-containing protein [Paracoccaceae bacterium]
MSDNDGKKTLGVRSGPRASNVKQSFSHGRSKNVVVETKRKRVVVPKAGTTTTGIQSSNLDRAKGLASGVSDTEMERRLKALQAAKAREADEVAQREASAKEREKEREQRRLEQENRQRELKKAEEIKSEKEAQAEATKKQAEEQAKRAAVEAKTVTKPDAPQRREFSDSKSTRPSSPNSRKKDRESDDRSSGRGRGDEGRRSGKLTLSQALDGGERSHQKSMAAMKRKQERARQKAIGQPLEREKIVRDVQVPEAIIVSELANRMAERSAEVVKSLMKMGMMVTQNQVIDADTAELIIEEFGHKIVRVSASDVEDAITEIKDNPEDLKP